MGILNVTPDSFSDGGQYFDTSKAVKHALNMLEEGADIIDIGGESSRPGARTVSVNEELQRVIPVMEEILGHRPDAVISIDTSKSEVADKALETGASIVNDISGLSGDKNMCSVISKHNSAVVIMHMKGNPENMQINPYYDDVVGEIKSYLEKQLELALSFGIEKIFLDPGIGFGKSIVHNLEILNRLDEFNELGFPLLIGVSRKSFLGKLINLQINDRDDVTSMVELVSMLKGAKAIRTHNVKKAFQAKTLFSFIDNPEVAVNV